MIHNYNIFTIVFVPTRFSLKTDFFYSAFVGIRNSNKDDNTNASLKSANDLESSESVISGVEIPDRTGSSSGASTPGDKEGEKSSSKRVTRSKGQGM